ncbi:MAG: hypothetical protein GXY36_08455 [Chloroflexi bacterium]|jgi:flavodoxin|nr:hypothetical protein [Chloroflexota bacterium]
MNVLVLYQSRKGHTRAAAEAIAQAARQMDHAVTVKAVIEVRQEDVANADALFVGTWVHGLILFNVRPAGAELWVPALPPLEGKPAGVFCTYLFHPHNSLSKLAAMLEARGATVRGQHAIQRRNPGQGAEAFVQGVLQAGTP